MEKALSVTKDLFYAYDSFDENLNDLLVAAQHLDWLAQYYRDRNDLELFWWALEAVTDNIKQYSESIAFVRPCFADCFHGKFPSELSVPDSIPDNGKASNA